MSPKSDLKNMVDTLTDYFEIVISEYEREIYITTLFNTWNDPDPHPIYDKTELSSYNSTA